MEQKLLKSGIDGLDQVLGGGILEGSIVTISGPSGCGKSTAALQFAYKGAVENNEPALFISIEESRNDVYFHCVGFNWDISKAEKERKFVLLDYPIHEVEQILNQYSAVQEIIQSTGVKRVVIDSVMPIALYFANNDDRKRGFVKFIENLRKWGVTTIIIAGDAKSPDLNQTPATEYGIENYTDGWICFHYLFNQQKMQRERYIEVLKMKGMRHSNRIYPVEIDENGMRVVLGNERPSSGDKPKVAEQKPAQVPPKKLAFKATMTKDATPVPIGKKLMKTSNEEILSKIAAAKARLTKKGKQ